MDARCEACGLVTMRLRAAEALADAIEQMVRLGAYRGGIDSRSLAADALLDYRQPGGHPPGGYEPGGVRPDPSAPPRCQWCVSVDQMRERHRLEAEQEARRRGHQPGALVERYRRNPPAGFDASRATAAVLEALNREGVDAWDGDGVSCVVQMLEALARQRDQVPSPLLLRSPQEVCTVLLGAAGRARLALLVQAFLRQRRSLRELGALTNPRQSQGHRGFIAEGLALQHRRLTLLRAQILSALAKFPPREHRQLWRDFLVQAEGQDEGSAVALFMQMLGERARQWGLRVPVR